MSQLLFTAIALRTEWGSWLDPENLLYEYPAVSLVSGHGFAIPRDRWEDPHLTVRFRATHPGSDAAYVPAVTLPPGYSLLLAAVYAVFGPGNHVAAIATNYAMLAVLLVLVVRLVESSLGRDWRGGLALVMLAVFPQWAFASAEMWSDMLHALAIAAFAAVWLRPTSRLAIDVAGGVLLAAASLTRPYSTLLPLAFVVSATWFKRSGLFPFRRIGVLAIACAALMGLWTVRNHYYFGKPYPVSAMGLGYSLWMATYQYSELAPQEMTPARMSGLVREAGANDGHLVEDNGRLLDAALRRIAASPAAYAMASLERIPRMWLLPEGPHGFLVWAAAKVFSVSVLIMAAVGLVRTRDTANMLLAGCGVIVAYYTLAFAGLNAEVRYVLPARPFAFILAAAAFLPRASSPHPPSGV